MNSWLGRALLVLAAVALILRVAQLDRRPLHNDEAVNADKIHALWEKGNYQYDPDEYHGPTLHYFTLPFLWLSPFGKESRFSDTTLRLAPVVFGAALILLLWFARDALGARATLGAAFLTAISPAMVFYSRYFIHEMLLLFFTVLLLVAGWRYLQSRNAVWAAVLGGAVGLMFATKETFVITLAALFGASSITIWMAPREGESAWKQLARMWNGKHVMLAAGCALFIAALFFTSFFTHPKGLLDAIMTYAPWTKRAGGHSPHIHPWYFYFEHLFWFHPVKKYYWSEGVILVLAILGGVATFRSKKLLEVHPVFARFTVLYTLLHTLIYCAIPYKTPWCLLGFYHGFIMLAGIGIAFLIEICRPFWSRVFLGLLLVAGASNLGYQTWRANFPMAADFRNPYVYSQTCNNIRDLVKRVDAVSQFHPDGKKAIIKVITDDSASGSYWPLPWYLRHFQNVGWYEKMPDDPYAPIILVNHKLQAYLDEKSDKKYLMVGLFELRPRVGFELYVEIECWTRYVNSLPKDRD